MANVKFFFTSDLNKYLNLATKDPMALYFVEDAATGYKALYKGENLIAVGSDATSMASGLMSAEDKIKLDALTVGGVNGLSAVDGTISIVDTAEGGKAIGVAISAQEGNALVAVEDGLFVPRAEEVVIPEYAIEKQETASEGFAATYKLKKTLGEEVSYVGDEINIAKDLVLKSATMQAVTEENVPYEGAVIGDPYIDMEFNDEAKTHLYIPMKGLVDSYSAGDGIEIIDNKISVKIAAESHGLVAVDGALALNLVTATSDGAMSKEDKAFIDAIPTIYVAREYEVSDKPVGTLVDYRDKEIRVMCPADTQWTLQNSGEGADANTYYIGFKAYAPKGAVSFKEDLAETIADDTMYYFENNEFAGVDAQGRSYSIVWLPAAKFDGSAWTYYGVNSSEGKYIGWYYSVDWYNANGVKIGADTIRINLTNEDCHTAIEPYYVTDYATKEDIAEISQSMSWGEL